MIPITDNNYQKAVQSILEIETYLRIPIAPGDSIIGIGVSREYLSQRFTKARRIRPCATWKLLIVMQLQSGSGV